LEVDQLTEVLVPWWAGSAKVAKHLGKATSDGKKMIALTIGKGRDTTR
jgi:hypothetical protein